MINGIKELMHTDESCYGIAEFGQDALGRQKGAAYGLSRPFLLVQYQVAVIPLYQAAVIPRLVRGIHAL